MKKLLLITVLTLAVFAFSACRYVGKGGVAGSGVRKTEKRNLPAFKSLESTGSYEIQINCQQPASFEIEGDDNILPLIKTEVRDGVLNISNQSGYRATKAIAVRINMPDLDAFTSTGAGAVRIANVKNDGLTISSTGAADIEAAGETKYVSISSTGAGNVDTNKLHAERAKVSVTGAASVDVYASQQLDVNVSGVGSVNYSGNPPVVNKKVSGIGSISKKD